MRLGLCCIFRAKEIRFRTTTASALKKAPRQARSKISELIVHNCQSLISALEYCHSHKIGAFRITSRFFPLATHPEFGYALEELDGVAAISELLAKAHQMASSFDIRLTTHPDPFIVLNSPNPEVVESSCRELEYHAELAELVGIDVINIHAGGVYKDKKEALKALAKNLKRLSPRVLSRLTLENDDSRFTPEELIPFCLENGLPFVYDVHHHRCNPDSWSVETATLAALKTWQREPLFHISSPKNGWQGPKIKHHHDYIDIADLPRLWYEIDPLTVEIEAKAKELAIERLLQEMGKVRLEIGNR